MNLVFLLWCGTLLLQGAAQPSDEEIECGRAVAVHAVYEPNAFCPDLISEATGPHISSFNKCRPLPQRRCVQRIPDNFIPPTNQKDFLFNPPSNNVRLSMPGARFPDFTGFANRRNEDCVTCWRFQEERQRWDQFLDFLESKGRFRFKDGPIRTVLDFGCGTGGFLSALADRNVRGLGFARNWRKLPYLETAAARGVLAMHMDFRNHVPMVSGAVDLVHCSWLMNILNTKEDIEAILMEWDRLVRPGGFVVQYGFRNKDPARYKELLAVVEATAALMRWTKIHWNDRAGVPTQFVLFFIYQKPVHRPTLGPPLAP